MRVTTTSFLFLCSLVAVVAADRDAHHAVPYLAHRRHHARKQASATEQPIRQRRRRSCKAKLPNTSILVASASPTLTADSTATETSIPTTVASEDSSTLEESTASPDTIVPASISIATPVSSSAETIVTSSAPATTARPTSSSSSKMASSSLAAPAPSPSSSGSEGGALQSKLLPIKPISFWTTSEEIDGALPLSDATLTRTKDIKELKRPYVKKEGKSAIEALYPKGSWNLSNRPRGGYSFYALGPQDKGKIDLSKAKEVTFGASYYFPEDFDFVLGGKLPGVYGGATAEGSVSCSGGARQDSCFSARMMWRTDGMGELYTYLPPSFEANKKVCDIPPFSECNPTYGASIARGSFKFARGAWTTVAMRVKLNDVGKENGELQLWANGKSMFSVSGLVMRTTESAKIWGNQFQTFFGGSTEEWSTPFDQYTYTADLTMAITEEF